MAPRVNGLSFVNMMELVGRFPSKTFQNKSYIVIYYAVKLASETGSLYLPYSPHWIICISSKYKILKALKANNFNHKIVSFSCFITNTMAKCYLQAPLLATMGYSKK